jgi:hypothetical protein
MNGTFVSVLLDSIAKKWSLVELTRYASNASILQSLPSPTMSGFERFADVDSAAVADPLSDPSFSLFFFLDDDDVGADDFDPESGSEGPSRFGGRPGGRGGTGSVAMRSSNLRYQSS